MTVNVGPVPVCRGVVSCRDFAPLGRFRSVDIPLRMAAMIDVRRLGCLKSTVEQPLAPLSRFFTRANPGKRLPLYKLFDHRRAEPLRGTGDHLTKARASCKTIKIHHATRKSIRGSPVCCQADQCRGLKTDTHTRGWEHGPSHCLQRGRARFSHSFLVAYFLSYLFQSLFSVTPRLQTTTK